MQHPELPRYTVPTLTPEQGARAAEVLQERLYALTELALTLKHVHWNVVGPHFIAVHEMLDPQVDVVLGYVDEIAERIATLGLAPVGTPRALVEARPAGDYSLRRATTTQHLHALNDVYSEVVAAHRRAAEDAEPHDRISGDLLATQVAELEKFQWFVRAHLESTNGALG